MNATITEARPLRALTLWQPWASAVAHPGKDIENRGQPTVMGSSVSNCGV